LLTSLYNNILLKILSADIEAAANGEFTESHHRLRNAYRENYSASIARAVFHHRSAFLNHGHHIYNLGN
jgi:hypothetical protein